MDLGGLPPPPRGQSVGLAGAWAATGGGEHQGRVVLTELSTQAGPPGTRWTLTSCPELSERFPAAHLRHVFHSPSRDVCLGSPPRSRERPEARPLQDAALYSPSTCGPLHGLENGRGTQAN